MTDVGALIADLVRAGVDPELVGRTARALAEREAVIVTDKQAERRRHADRERKRLRNSAESAETPAPPKEGPPDPLRNNPPTPIDADDAERARDSDDWPEGDARTWRDQIVAVCKSPWLDFAKEPGLTQTLGEAQAWKAAGCSWRLDVLPSIEAQLARARSPVRSWKWFTTAILQSRQDRTRTLKTVQSAEIIHVSEHRGPTSDRSAKRTAREANIARAFAAIDGLAEQRRSAGGGGPRDSG